MWRLGASAYDYGDPRGHREGSGQAGEPTRAANDVMVIGVVSRGRYDSHDGVDELVEWMALMDEYVSWFGSVCDPPDVQASGVVVFYHSTE